MISNDTHIKFILMNLNYNLMNYRDYNRVRIWDSSNPLAEEYVRACSFSQRVQYATIDSADSFVNCKDYTHTGYRGVVNSKKSSYTLGFFQKIPKKSQKSKNQKIPKIPKFQEFWFNKSTNFTRIDFFRYRF